MATSIVSNEVQNDLAIKSEVKDFRVYVKPDAEGKLNVKDIRLVTAGKDNATWNELDNPTKDENKNYVLAIEQSVRVPKAGTIEGAHLLIDDEEEFLNIFNTGLDAKLNRKLNASFKEISDDGTALTFEPTEEVYDTLELLREPTRRKNMSPLDKAMKVFGNLIKAKFPNLSDSERELKVRELMSVMGS